MTEPERRPNPKGWTPPKAPYNPYDHNDARPAEGYPSEFKMPGQEPKGFSSIPRNPTQYQKVNETMHRLNYTPRPQSTRYPGQYMVLRKVDTNRRLNIGTRYFGTFVTGTILVYFTFFHRWNDGQENVLSDFFRFRLSMKEKLTGLTDQEYDDLYHPRRQQKAIRSVRDAEYIPESLRKTKEGDFALNRPAEKHVLLALRIQQEQEEAMLREFELHKQFAKDFVTTDGGEPQKRRWWFW